MCLRWRMYGQHPARTLSAEVSLSPILIDASIDCDTTFLSCHPSLCGTFFFLCVPSLFTAKMRPIVSRQHPFPSSLLFPAF
jgi:hypothetical protein